ncbi:hypothetical protein [Methanolobus sp. ZRKC5]|uniref:hypothetical protein n=1 Tax=unclassified Methanolobus TaxID=2629569 RepID=UPI00313E1747
MEKKNIMFIVHHNNDFDHFLPLIIHLKEKKNMECKIVAFYTENEILKNKLHKHICNLHGIKFSSMIDISYLKKLNRAINKMYRYVIFKRGLSNPSGRKTPNLKRKHAKNSNYKVVQSVVFNLLDFILIRYLVLYSIFLLSDKKMREYIGKNNTDIAVIDHRKIEKMFLNSGPLKRFYYVYKGKVDPMDLVLFRFAKAAKDLNIPIFMVPHGTQPILIPDGDNNKLENPFNPDFLVVSSENDLIVHRFMQSTKSTLFLGDPRFDIDWINYLEKCALAVYKDIVKKPEDKTVLLYLIDNAVYSQDKEYKLKLHEDIISVVNDIDKIEIWIKHHPRHVFEINLGAIVKDNLKENIKQFGNSVDTNILIYNADICISTGSTTLIAPVLQKKPVILYKRWKEIHDAPTIYDCLNFNASSKEELVEKCKRVINGEYNVEESVLEGFYRNVFTGNYLYENMTEKYGNAIEEIISNNTKTV